MKGIERPLKMRKDLSVHRMIAFAGDFNCVLNSRDRSTRRVVYDKSSDILAEIIREVELEDIAECFRGDRDVGTTHARLDRVYLSCDLVDKCQSYAVTAISFSDRCLVKM